MRETRVRNAMGWYATRLGEHREAHEHCTAALAMFRRHHDRSGEADALDSLGHSPTVAGPPRRSTTTSRALTHYRDAGDVSYEAGCLDRLGHSHVALGRPGRARDTWHQAPRLFHAQYRPEDADRVRRRLAGLPAGEPVSPAPGTGRPPPG